MVNEHYSNDNRTVFFTENNRCEHINAIRTKIIKTIEVEDVTIAKAIKKALGTPDGKKHDVEIKVLKEEHKGLFGMKGANSAKIRATFKERPR